jgi:hypothetical protein
MISTTEEILFTLELLKKRSANIVATHAKVEREFGIDHIDEFHNSDSALSNLVFLDGLSNKYSKK